MTETRFLRAMAGGGAMVAILGCACMATAAVADEAPQLPEGPKRVVTATLHAEGVQIYECRPTASGATQWQFREPLATLMVDDKTVGRHFAGPTWALSDGSSVVGKVTAKAAGATKGDVPLLRLDVMDRYGAGLLSSAVTVERLNTHGGVFAGDCGHAGAFHLEPYSADYVFSTVP